MYTSATGAAACTTCPDNSGTGNITGSTAITACVANAGFYGANGDTPMACAAGMYTSATGAAACTTCPANSGTGTIIGSTAIAACKASAGYNGVDGEAAVKCPVDTFKADIGSADCSACPANTKTSDKTGSTASTDCLAAAATAAAAAGTSSDTGTDDVWWIILLVLMGLCFVAAAAFFLQKKGKVKPVRTRLYYEGLKKAFDSFDTDNSGELSKEEFRAVMMMSGKNALTELAFDRLFQVIDKDASGVISFDEYYAWSQE
jgi:hypothetical protein